MKTKNLSQEKLLKIKHPHETNINNTNQLLLLMQQNSIFIVNEMLNIKKEAISKTQEENDNDRDRQTRLESHTQSSTTTVIFMSKPADTDTTKSWRKKVHTYNKYKEDC